MNSTVRPDAEKFALRVADAVPSLLAYWDATLSCRFSNLAYARCFGTDPDRLIGQPMREVLGAELFAFHEPYVLRVLEGKRQVFAGLLAGDGAGLRQAITHYEPFVSDGEVVGFASQLTVDPDAAPSAPERPSPLERAMRSLQDAMARRRGVEESLFELQQRLALTLASIEAGFIATDRTGRVTSINAVAERVTGWRSTEAVGIDFWKVFSRDDRQPSPGTRGLVDVLVELGLSLPTAQRIVVVARDGRRTPVEAKSCLTYGGDGAVRGVVIVFRDMTRLLAAEEESNRLAAIVKSSQDAIIGKTLAGRITSWNPGAERMFGYSADEAVGRPIQMLFPTDRLPEEMRIISDVVRGSTVPPFDTVRRAKDGRLLEVSVSISPIRDGHGRIVGASKIARDVSRQRRAERLEAENLHIREVTRTKNAFFANMSHELRTPLNAIIGFAELLQRGAATVGSPKFDLYVGNILSSGRHLLELVNDILDVAKIESGKLRFHPQPVDLRELFAESVETVRPDASQKGIALAWTVDEDLTGIVVDPSRLQQVLYNYLSNALKFTPRGGSVTARARPQDARRFRIEVEDTGIGIEPADIESLFSEFSQLERGYSAGHRGSGLGLALTKRLVEAQGGTVGVHSLPGIGSVFFATLERVPATEAPPGAAKDGRP